MAQRLVILASGLGTNFEAITRACQTGIIPRTDVVGLICNREGANALQRAKSLGVPSFLVASASFKTESGFNKAEYERELLRTIESLDPDWICLAGYMLLLGKPIIEAYQNRILNLHPSLLPEFRGLHARRQALQAKAQKTGCTVHLVTEVLDDGPILSQKEILVDPDETEESLEKKMKPLEHETYIEALKNLALNSLPNKIQNRDQQNDLRYKQDH